ncbi:glyoxalase [Archangium sp. Cb G35]|uniref:VOC family protein n=1 Tax=Archangium sp. Cb G35 TaxID=1920190 RepID=UPI000936D0D2|nr:VOC family protein [Archangium sp. Cb G35]OJT16930.1 glyoxalase [Archangium sp. Cb G35]
MPKAIPEGYHSLTPSLSLRDAAKAIEFYKEALGAKELFRLPMPGGKVAHAELQIGDSRLMVADSMPEWGNKSAKDFGGTPVGLCVYTENVDALYERFLKAGGKQLRPLQNEFYGDRTAQVEDPEGYKWTLMQHVEEVSLEEMQRRMEKMMGG